MRHSLPASGHEYSAHWGAGELLLQYQPLKMGIDSARMTTDPGVDLVVYAPGDRSANTVQVKTKMSAKPAGGRGPLSRGWYFPDQCPAQLLAFVALDTDTAWHFTLKEARMLTQQHSERGIRQLYWRLKAAPVGSNSPRHEAEMDGYLLATRATQLFPK
jgi:hypothetical protein